MTNNDESTCGRAGHDEACLCDVVIPETTEIDYGLTDLWHAERILASEEYQDFGAPWTRKSFCDFMDTLTKAHDMWASQAAGLGDGWKAGGRNGEPIEYTVLRQKVIDLLHEGESMVDVPSILDHTLKDVLKAMTNDMPAVMWEWDDHEWLAAEAVIYDSFKNNGWVALAAMLGDGANQRTVETLAEWYGVKINENGQDRVERLKQALRDGMTPGEAAEHFAALGVDCSKKQLTDMRRRLVARGEIREVAAV